MNGLNDNGCDIVSSTRSRERFDLPAAVAPGSTIPPRGRARPAPQAERRQRAKPVRAPRERLPAASRCRWRNCTQPNASPLRCSTDQPCDQCLLRRFGHAVEEGVREEQAPDVPGLRGATECQVNDAVKEPAAVDGGLGPKRSTAGPRATLLVLLTMWKITREWATGTWARRVLPPAPGERRRSNCPA